MKQSAFSKFSKLSKLLWAWSEHNRQKFCSSWICNWATASTSEQQNDLKTNIQQTSSNIIGYRNKPKQNKNHWIAAYKISSGFI